MRRTVPENLGIERGGSERGILGLVGRRTQTMGQEEATAIPTASMQIARRAIQVWLSNRSKLERREDPGIPKAPDKKKAQEEMKQQLKQAAIERYNLLEPPREGGCKEYGQMARDRKERMANSMQDTAPGLRKGKP